MDGVCSISVMVPNQGLDLASFAEGAVEGFQEGVGEAFQLGSFSPFRSDGWAVEPRRRRIADKDRDGIRLEVDTKGFGETVTSRIEIYHVDEPDYAMFVFANAVEVEQWEPDLPGFEMLWNSVRFTKPAEHD